MRRRQTKISDYSVFHTDIAQIILSVRFPQDNDNADFKETFNLSLSNEAVKVFVLL